MIKTNPKVSIVTPSYNQGEYLEKTIDSVLSQTYSNIEFIIVDGCSTDSTAKVLQKYRDTIAHIIVEKDTGQANAINKGLKIASGDLLTWLNSDDLLQPYAIEKVVLEFENNPTIDFVYGDIKLIDQVGVDLSYLRGSRISKPSVFYELDLPIPQQGSTWRRSVTEKIGLLDERWHYVLDREFFLRICLSHNVKYMHGVILGSFRQHNQSKSIKMKDSWISELPAMYLSLVNNRSWLFDKDSSVTKRTLASGYVHAAYLAIWNKKFKIGIENIIDAVRHCNNILFHRYIYRKPYNKLIFYFGLKNDQR